MKKKQRNCYVSDSVQELFLRPSHLLLQTLSEVGITNENHEAKESGEDYSQLAVYLGLTNVFVH